MTGFYGEFKLYLFLLFANKQSLFSRWPHFEFILYRHQFKLQIEPGQLQKHVLNIYIYLELTFHYLGLIITKYFRHKCLKFCEYCHLVLRNCKPFKYGSLPALSSKKLFRCKSNFFAFDIFCSSSLFSVCLMVGCNNGFLIWEYLFAFWYLNKTYSGSWPASVFLARNCEINEETGEDIKWMITIADRGNWENNISVKWRCSLQQIRQKELGVKQEAGLDVSFSLLLMQT